MSYVAHSKDLVCSEGTLIHYAVAYSHCCTCMHGCYLLLYKGCKLKQNLIPNPNPKFCNFPNFEARILPKLRTFLVKLFSCDQNFSSAKQMQLQTVSSSLQRGDFITFLFAFTQTRILFGEQALILSNTIISQENRKANYL